MVTRSASSWPLRGVTFALWALAVASAAHWGTKLTSGTESVAIDPVSARGPSAPDPVALARLLGAGDQPAVAVAPPSMASRFRLLGVVAGPGKRGAALIAMDGRPPRPYRVGSQ